MRGHPLFLMLMVGTARDGLHKAIPSAVVLE